MTQSDKLAGEVIRSARQQRRYTYRRIEDLTSELERRDPDRFERVPKTVMWNMETGGETFFLKRAISPGKIRALIEVLFGGDSARFQQETGLHIIDVLTDSAGKLAESDIPLHLEMETPTDIRRFISPPVPCDFALEIRTGRMLPLLTQGQTVYCMRAEIVRPGEIAVIHLPAEGLALATALPDHRFRFERTRRDFTLADGGSVYGVVAWLRPVLPL